MAQLTFAANFMRNRIQCLNEEFTISICWNSFSMTSVSLRNYRLNFVSPNFGVYRSNRKTDLYQNTTFVLAHAYYYYLTYK